MIEKTFKTGLGTIHYWINDIDSTQLTLVFLPGLTADNRLFEKQIEYFSGKYNCFVWDAPAHGKSRPFELKFSMEDMAKYLYDIFQVENISKPVLIGQSLGGYISQVFMEIFPYSASGFVSIDSCSLKRKYYTWWELALLKRTKWMYMSFPWKLLLKLGIVGTSKTEYGRKIMKETWACYEKIEYCELSAHGSRIFAESVEADKPYDIKCPILLLCGTNDNAGSAKSYNRRWAKQDGYNLVWLKGAGHNSNADMPEKVNQLIDEFIQKEVLVLPN